MCGIFGLIACKSSLTLNETRDIVNTLFKLSETRGKESSGIAIKNLRDGTISVYKKPIRASKLIKAEDYCRFFINALESCFLEIGIAKVVATPFSLISHTRLVTNGTQQNNDNNQPVIKDGAVIVHNGIIVNTEILWEKHSILHREYEVDTEIISGLIRSLMKHGKCIQEATSIAYKEIFGSASIAMLMDNSDTLLIATNTGSLYWMKSNTNDTIIFASERYILSKFIEKNCSKIKFKKRAIQWVRPKTGYVIDLYKLIPIEFQFDQNKYPVAPKEDKKKERVETMASIVKILKNWKSDVGGGRSDSCFIRRELTPSSFNATLAI